MSQLHLSIPLLDYIGNPLFVLLFCTLLWLQWRFPLRRLHFSSVRRLIRNLIFSLPALALLRLLLIPIPLGAAWWAEKHQIGLLHLLKLPNALSAVAGFVAMDWAYYWWHYA